MWEKRISQSVFLRDINTFQSSCWRASAEAKGRTRHCLVRPKQQNRKLSKSDVEQKEEGGYRSSFLGEKSSASSKLFCKFTSRKSWEKIFLEFGSISDPNCCSNNILAAFPGLFQNNTAVQRCVQVILMEAIESRLMIIANLLTFQFTTFQLQTF